MSEPQDQQTPRPEPDEAAEIPDPSPETPESLREERDSLLGRLQRVSADYVNYQKRMSREIEQAREYANEQLMKALLGVIDDMERALAHARENHDEADPLLQGMQLVHDKAIATLKQFGLTPIEAEGQRFDPDLHSAMMQQPTSEHPPMTVLQEVQKGYTLKGRTLRPAAVIVATPPAEGAESGEGAPEPEAGGEDEDDSDGPVRVDVKT